MAQQNSPRSPIKFVIENCLDGDGFAHRAKSMAEESRLGCGCLARKIIGYFDGEVKFLLENYTVVHRQT